MSKLKLSIAALTLMLLLNACSSEKIQTIEGETDLEIAACKLAKEYLAFQVGHNYKFNFDQVKCEFKGNGQSPEGNVFLISMEPTLSSPDYEKYIERVNSQPHESVVNYRLWSIPDVGVVMDESMPSGPSELGRLFIKDGERFRNVNKEDIPKLPEIL